MNKARTLIMTLLLGLGFVVLVGMYCQIKTQEAKVVYIQDPNIPSAREIQQRLTDLNNPRYDPNGVDGWIGKDSRTAWDNYICDRYAKRAIEGE